MIIKIKTLIKTMTYLDITVRKSIYSLLVEATLAGNEEAL